MYEGKPVSTPDPGQFWRLCQEHSVNTMFAAPTAMRAIRKDDPKLVHLSKYDTSSLQKLFLAGERCDPSTMKWIAEHLPTVAVTDHWWQTETGLFCD